MNYRDVSPLRNKETLLGSILLIGSAAFLFGVARFPETAARYRAIAPSFFPNLLGVALAILSSLLLIEGIRNPPANILDIEASRGNKFRATGLLVVLILFITFFKYLGFPLVSFLFTTTLQVLLGENRYLRALLVSFVVTAALYLVFVTLLRVPLPVGSLFQ